MPTVPAIGSAAEWSIGGVEGLGGAGTQLASQIRTKAVEVYQDVFHTQV